MTGRDHPCCPKKEEGSVSTVVNQLQAAVQSFRWTTNGSVSHHFSILAPEKLFLPLVWWRPPFIWCNWKPNAPLWQVQFHPPPLPPPPYFVGTLVCFCLKLFQLLQEIGSAGVECQTAGASRRAISHFLHFLSRAVRCFAWRLPSCCFLTRVRLSSLPARRSTTSDLPRCLREKSVTSCLSPKYKYVATLHI